MDQTNRLNRIEESYKLFNRFKCCSEKFDDDKLFDEDVALVLVEEDKMRCHIMNCLAALRVVEIQRERKQKDLHNKKHELVKRKVFRVASSIMIDTEFDDEVVVNTILKSFPDDSKMSDDRSWLPMHWAVILFVQNKVNAEEVHILHTADLLAMHRLSVTICDEQYRPKRHCDEGELPIGCTPAHLLCMQKEPNMSMVRYFCLRDPKAFRLCDQIGRCALHLVAQYSESVELLQAMLQIDERMVKKSFKDNNKNICKPLGLLFRRLDFPTFHEMVACLIEFDSTVEVIFNGIIECLGSHRVNRYRYHLDYPSSQGERMLTLLGILLNANLDVTEYENSRISHWACCCLRGELAIAVLSLFLTKNSTGLKSVDTGSLLIHKASSYSSLDVLKFLLEAYPESLTMLSNTGNNLLHLAFQEDFYEFPDVRKSDYIADMREKVQYLCEQCPAFIHQKNNKNSTPLHHLIAGTDVIDMKSVSCICNADATAVRDKWFIGTVNPQIWNLPLHLLMRYKLPRSEVSAEGDCFRLFLSLYPASAGLKDGWPESPYDLAIRENLSVYFIRILLSADPTIDPVRRYDLNFAARRDGMFLAFRALSTNLEPIIWAKLRYENRALLARVISYL